MCTTIDPPLVQSLPDHDVHRHIFIDHEASEIICLVASVCLHVCLSVCTLLFEPLDLDFWHEGRP